MTREELLDQIAIEVLKNLPHNFARDAYNIAEVYLNVGMQYFTNGL